MVWPFTGPSLQDKIATAAEEKAEEVQAKVKDQMAQQMALQMQIQKSVNIAMARDSLQWLYSCLLGGITLGIAAKKPVPGVAAIPVVLGGFTLANMADMAYGNKLIRVTREAEHIMESESARLVPPKQAFFYEKFKEEDRTAYPDVTAVGTYWPQFHPWHRGDK